MVVKPGSMLDLRNLYHHEGSLVARHGMQKKIQFVDYLTSNDATHILAGIAIRSERIGIVVTFYEPTRHVTIHRVDGQGTVATPLGNWPFWWSQASPILAWPGTETPKVILAEIYGTVYFAHEERYQAQRAATYVYDPYFEPTSDPTKDASDVFGGNTLGPLYANLTDDHNYTAEQIHTLTDGDGNLIPNVETVRFRGVVRHLDYLFGWGYGTELEARPELVRVSYPGQPRRFHPDHYFIAGDRRDPVTSCKPARKTLLVFKETETHRIHGYSRATFGIEPYDNLYGCLGGRLSRNVSGQVFFWSAEGPRVGGDTGPSQKIHLPLDLGGFEPATLVERTDFKDGWCDYIDEVEQLYFGFGRRLYCLSLRNPQDPRWAYWELARKAYTGFRLYGGEGAGAPDGWPEVNTHEFQGVENGCDWPYLVVTVDNVDQTGEEYIQLWLKKDGPVFGTPVDGGWTFAVDSNADGVPDDWTRDISGITTALTSFGIDGDWYRMAVYGGSAADDVQGLYRVWTDDVEVGATYRFQVEASCWNFSVISTMRVKMEFLTSGDALIGSAVTQETLASSPMQMFVQAVAPATSAKIRLTLEAEVDNAGAYLYAAFRNPRLWKESTPTWFQASLGIPGEITSTTTPQVLPPVPITDPGMGYEYAVRYVSASGIPTVGYEGSPSTWPIASQGSFTGAGTLDAPGLRIVETVSTVNGEAFVVELLCEDNPALYGGSGPPKYNTRDILVEWDNGTPQDFLLARGESQLLLLKDNFYGVFSGNTYVVRAQYDGPDADSPWSPTTQLDVELFGGSSAVPSFTIDSPSTGVYRVNWDFAAGAVVPDGWIKSIEVWDNYDDDGGTGEYRRRWFPCPNRSFGFGGTSVCLAYLPADPLSIDLGASSAGVTVGVKIREVYAAGDPDGFSGFYPPIYFSASDFTAVQSQLITS